MNVNVLMNNCLYRLDWRSNNGDLLSLSLSCARYQSECEQREKEKDILFSFFTPRFKPLSFLTVWRLMSSYIDCTCMCSYTHVPIDHKRD